MENTDTAALMQACETLGKISEMLGIPEDETTGEPAEIYEAISEMRHLLDVKDAAIAACERQVNELAEINKELLEAVKHAQRYLRSPRFDAGNRNGVAVVLEAAIFKAEQQ